MQHEYQLLLPSRTKAAYSPHFAQVLFETSGRSWRGTTRRSLGGVGSSSTSHSLAVIATVPPPFGSSGLNTRRHASSPSKPLPGPGPASTVQSGAAPSPSEQTFGHTTEIGPTGSVVAQGGFRARNRGIPAENGPVGASRTAFQNRPGVIVRWKGRGLRGSPGLSPIAPSTPDGKRCGADRRHREGDGRPAAGGLGSVGPLE
jgi:hypothetical protein